MSDLRSPRRNRENSTERDAHRIRIGVPHRSPPIGGTQTRRVRGALRCTRCAGNIMIEPVAPGLFDIACFLCRRSIGDITEHELIAEHGLERWQVRALEEGVYSFLWVVVPALVSGEEAA